MTGPVVRTPVTELCGYEYTGNRIFMKRDDLQPFCFGGNKVRIAAEFISDMEKSGCDAMLMYGDLRSNLCRVLSAMCFEEHIPARMIGTTEHGSEDGNRSFNEQITQLYGTELVTCLKDGIAETVDEEMERFRAEGLKPYYIYGDRFGRGNEGTAACAYAECWREITEWEEEQKIRFDMIVTPYGTGATQSGLVAGMLRYSPGDLRRIVGISISSRSYGRSVQSLLDGVTGYFEKMNLPVPENIGDSVEIHTEYNGGGYGLSNGRVESAIRTMLLENAVPLNTVYTGKAFLGMLDFLETEHIRGLHILFLNTGGLPLFFDDLEKGI